MKAGGVDQCDRYPERYEGLIEDGLEGFQKIKKAFLDDAGFVTGMKSKIEQSSASKEEASKELKSLQEAIITVKKGRAVVKESIQKLEKQLKEVPQADTDRVPEIRLAIADVTQKMNDVTRSMGDKLASLDDVANEFKRQKSMVARVCKITNQNTKDWKDLQDEKKVEKHVSKLFGDSGTGLWGTGFFGSKEVAVDACGKCYKSTALFDALTLAMDEAGAQDGHDNIGEKTSATTAKFDTTVAEKAIQRARDLQDTKALQPGFRFRNLRSHLSSKPLSDYSAGKQQVNEAVTGLDTEWLTKTKGRVAQEKVFAELEKENKELAEQKNAAMASLATDKGESAKLQKRSEALALELASKTVAANEAAKAAKKMEEGAKNELLEAQAGLIDANKRLEVESAAVMKATDEVARLGRLMAEVEKKLKMSTHELQQCDGFGCYDTLFMRQL